MTQQTSASDRELAARVMAAERSIYRATLKELDEEDDRFVVSSRTGQPDVPHFLLDSGFVPLVACLRRPAGPAASVRG